MKKVFTAIGIVLLWIIAVYTLAFINSLLISFFKPKPPFSAGILSLGLALVEAYFLHRWYRRSIKGNV